MRTAQLWPANHLYDGDAYAVVRVDGEKMRQVSGQTIPQSTPRGISGRKCTMKLHLYALPKCRAGLKHPDIQQSERHAAECGPEEEAGTGVPPPKDENSIPCGAAPVPYIEAGGGSG